MLMNLHLAKEIGNLPAGGVRPIRPVHGVLLHIRAEVAAHSANLSFGWVSRTHDATIGLDRILAFEYRHQNRSGRHERCQALKERALLVDDVKSLRLRFAEGNHFRGDDLQSCALKAMEDLTDDMLFD